MWKVRGSYNNRERSRGHDGDSDPQLQNCWKGLVASGLGQDIWNKTKETLGGLFQDQMDFVESEMHQWFSTDSKKEEWEKVTRHMAFLSVWEMIF